MSDHFEIAIIGSGPAGLSAGCRAAAQGVSHILLESAKQISDTIYRYQKGKHVMAEPEVLPLRCELPFDAGSREAILKNWALTARNYQPNAHFGAAVTAIRKQGERFHLEIKGGAGITADSVVLAIGMQGNLRKLGVEGEDLPFVQYQLDDPDEYQGETIVVVGAGDAAIENAVALSGHNDVIIVNRRDEFSRAKDGNNAAILAAIEKERIRCYYDSSPDRVEELPAGSGKKGRLVLNTKEGVADVDCDRIIARLGAIPPRRFVESCGIEFPSEDPNSIPAVSSRYESNVPGLYVIGALGGYPLIKQALNQGYEVVEFIRGNMIEPADAPILKDKLAPLLGTDGDLDAVIERIQKTVPLLAPLTALQLREFLLDSDIRTLEPDEVVFRRNDYTTTFYSIIEGEVGIQVDPRSPESLIRLDTGKFFGEMSLISGRRRSATVIATQRCILLETPRRSMNKLIQSVKAVADVLDNTFVMRALQTQLVPDAAVETLELLAGAARTCRYKPKEKIYQEGDASDCIHLVRSGSVTGEREVDGRPVVLSYLPAGQYFGDMGVISGKPREETAIAAVATETIRIEAEAFQQAMERDPGVRDRVQAVYRQRLLDSARADIATAGGEMMGFLMQQGLGEATDALLIDEALCIRCDQCERACAATHGNVSRLNREAGPTFANLHVPTSCRHCEHPHCMKDCPPDAIHRSANGEVFIDDSCIGCGNCERNCPYDVIQMGVETEKSPSLWSWLVLGKGPEPGETLKPKGKDLQKTAVKCDMCKDRPHGPACVQSCPTGAAIRVSPEEFMPIIMNR